MVVILGLKLDRSQLISIRFCSSQCQGKYDLALGVDPSNKNRIIVGGITVWGWEQGQGWNQVNGFGPFNIHSDNHDVVWHPTNSSKVYIVNDGGVYFSNSAGMQLGRR